MKSLISFLLTIYKGLTEREPYFKELVSDYEDYHITSKISTLSILRANLISEWIEPYSSILDVGCGEGFLMEFLFRTKKCKVYGIDISKKAIEIVRLKGFEGIIRDVDKEGLGLSKNEKYDYILFIEVLEHLKYPHEVLIEACKHARKGVVVS